MLPYKKWVLQSVFGVPSGRILYSLVDVNIGKSISHLGEWFPLTFNQLSVSTNLSVELTRMSCRKLVLNDVVLSEKRNVPNFPYPITHWIVNYFRINGEIEKWEQSILPTRRILSIVES